MGTWGIFSVYPSIFTLTVSLGLGCDFLVLVVVPHFKFDV